MVPPSTGRSFALHSVRDADFPVPIQITSGFGRSGRNGPRRFYGRAAYRRVAKLPGEADGVSDPLEGWTNKMRAVEVLDAGAGW